MPILGSGKRDVWRMPQPCRACGQPGRWMETLEPDFVLAMY